LFRLFAWHIRSASAQEVSDPQLDAEDFPTLKPGRSTFNIANIPVHAPSQGNSQQQEAAQPVLMAQAVALSSGLVSFEMYEILGKAMLMHEKNF
jgi:hypothetical protein